MSEENPSWIADRVMGIEGWMDSRIPKNINWTIVLFVYASLLVVLNFTRLFYDNFWGDECYDIMLSRGTYENLMYMTEYHDNHPPLHYLYFKAMCDMFGQNPFVYNLTSYIPYLIMIILSVTIVRKDVGIQVAAVVVTLASILGTTQYYMTEARQYQLALMLLFVMFIILYRILQDPRPGYFVMMTAVYIMACYTHYYALMAGGLMYVAYGISCITDRNRTAFLYAGVSLAVAVLAFLPWTPFLMTEATDLTDHFWLNGMPSLIDDITWFFGNNIVYVVFFPIMFLPILYFLFRAGVVKGKAISGLLSFFDLGEARWRWTIIGLFSVFFLVIFMSVYSLIFTPLISLRYIYPLSGIVWLFFAVFIPGCKARKTLMVLVMAFILIPGIPQCCSFMIDEYDQNQQIMDTMDVTRPFIEKDDLIISDEWMFAGNECRYYYSVEPDYYPIWEIPDHLSMDHDNWVFIKTCMDDGMRSHIESKGFDCELVKEEGRVGSNILWVYKVTA